MSDRDTDHPYEEPTSSDSGGPGAARSADDKDRTETVTPRGDASRTPSRKRLGDFDLLREIGRGGMGVVYEALQLSLNRRVALKVLPPGLGLSRQAVKRFEREAKAAAKLHHTNIVPVFATGEEEGSHYYAMELVEGQPLSEVLRDLSGAGSNPLMGETVTKLGSAEQVASRSETSQADSGIPSLSDTQVGGRKWFNVVAKLIADVADALEYAHGRGVIHRDIKPANLMLSKDGRLCVTDFGLARVAQEPGMTVSGSLLGTPAYMSPEQITAGRVKLDHRTDVYSLGAVFYEMLAQRRPFPGDHREEVLGRILTKDPRPPRRFNPRVPLDLETIALKAMEKDPDRRYATAGELANDLRQYLGGGLILARRAGPLRRSWKSIRRHPMVTTVTLALVVVSALGTFAWQAASGRNLERARRALAEARYALDQGEYGRALELADEARRRAPGLRAARVVRARILMAKGNLRAAADEALEALQEDPDDWTAHLVLAEVARHGTFGDISIDEHVARVDALAPDTAESYYLRQLLVSSAREAVALLDRALELDPAHARALLARSNRNSDLKEFAKAMADADRLVAVRPRSSGGHLQRGAIFRAQQRFDEALGEYDRAIELDPDNPANYNERAKLHQERGDLEDALADITRALELDPEIANYQARRAFFNALLERDEAAVADARNALALNPANLWAYRVLFYVYRTSARDSDFDQTAEELRSGAESWVDLDARARAYVTLLDGYQLEGRTEEFEQTAEAARAAAADWTDPAARNELYAGLAFFYSRVGENRRALESATLAIAAKPEDVDSRRIRIEALEALNDDAGFEAECDALATIDVVEPDPLRFRVGALGSACHRWEQSLELADGMTREYPDWYLAYEERGVAHFFLGRLEDALIDFTRVIELNPYYRMGYNNRAAVNERLGRSEENLADLEKAVEVDPGSSDSWSNLAHAKIRSGRVRDALADFEKAIEISPFHAPAHAGRGEALVILGDCDGAMEALERTLGLNPKAITLVNLAALTNKMFHFCPERYDAAMELDLASRALEKTDEPAVLVVYGQALYRNGRYREALENIQKALAPSEQEASFYSAMCLWRLGRRAEARAHYEKSAGFMDKQEMVSPVSIRVRQEAATLLGMEP